MKKTLLLLTALLVTFSGLLAQEQVDSMEIKRDAKYHNWFNKSPVEDQVYGAEVYRAYDQLLKDKKSTTVIVAVIDGGIDINHEDLKENIWINKNEIPENGIDDDNNGYIDDINGWNFLGNSKGENISFENLEVTRIYKKFNGVKADQVADKDKEAYKSFKAAKKSYSKQLKQAQRQKEGIEKFKTKYFASYDKVSKVLGKEEIELQDLDSLKLINKDLKKDIKFLYRFVKFGFNPELFDTYGEMMDEQLNYHLNINFDAREIIGDDISDIASENGNNNVYGPEAFHGTFVAGIIGAQRNNDLGIDGIAENVKIMALKTVPNGDERDKDVAKAIRYAADNGARVINMSFGKELSPYKNLVDDAFKYAEEKGVLIVHAAGNDGFDIDKVKQYPTKNITETKQISTYITVGASSIKNNEKLAASFTNYGKEMVEIFAPGVQVKSLAPESKYEIGDGTSFSAPVVSGVAALIISYYPELTALQVKELIVKSAIKYPELEVNKPGDYSRKKKKVAFSELSRTGGIVSAYEALKLAAELKK
jgi:subtilisin family serine protease